PAERRVAPPALLQAEGAPRPRARSSRSLATFVTGSRAASKRPGIRIRLTLLQTHVVLYRLHAPDIACNLHRRRFVGRRAHESAQLDHALERLDVDFRGLERG